ncbi:hypothetical protein Ancab_018866 [Ancistrocladus abbreviatus]
MAATSTSDVTTTTTTTAAAATNAAGNTTEGPVLNLINKRLRALRKKHNRIVQTEESLSQGKTLNHEQQELLRSKSSVLSLIDELEKLRGPLSSAVSEEISFALQHRQSPTQPVNANSEEDAVNAKKYDVVEDLLNLLYFGGLFDVMPQSEFTSLMLTRTHERGCCLTYDYVTDDATDLLGERDLDLISALKGLLISRPVDSSLSHKNALQRCMERAKLWLAKSEQPIHPESNVTYAGLREKLNKIMSSDYYTTTPEMKAAVEMAAAAAAGNFGSFQVSVHGSMMPASVPVQVEGSVGEYNGTEENITHFEEYEKIEDQTDDPVGELQKDNVESENSPEEVSTQTDQLQQTHVVENQRDVDSKEQHYVPRNYYQNPRGGRGSGGSRRGYPNSRGSQGSGRGGYQNGRNQYYEQSGNHYFRNYNRMRGRGGSGNNYYSHAAAAVQGNYAQAGVGLAL